VAEPREENRDDQPQKSSSYSGYAGDKVRLKQRDTGWGSNGRDEKELGKDAVRGRAETILAENIAHLTEAQELLYANDVYSVLIILAGDGRRR
jgi:hypothetical protein